MWLMFLADGSGIFVLCEWVVKIGQLAKNHDLTGQPVGQPLITGGWVVKGLMITVVPLFF